MEGRRIILRPWAREDIAAFLVWFNDPDVTQYLGNAYPNLSREAEEAFYDQTAMDKHRYGIVTRDGGLLIGNCAITHIDSQHRSAEVGIVIGSKAHWGQGFGREALGMLLEIAFDGLALHRVGLTYGAFNIRGERCYRAVGFREEGRTRDAWFVRGQYYDLVSMGILEHEYRALRGQQEGTPR